MTESEFITKGKELMEKGKFEEAEKQFRDALKANSNSAEASIWLARTALLHHDLKGARRRIDEALKANPNEPEAIALQGVIKMIAKKFGDAVLHLEKAKALNPKLEMTYFNLARSYRKLKKFDLAGNAARKAIELNPKNFQAHAELSYLLNRKGRTAEGIRHMAEAIRINPLFLKGYVVLGEIYKLAGKGSQAMRIYRRGLKYNPMAHVLRQELLGLYALKGDFPSAYREAAQLAVRRNHYGDYLRLGNYALILGLFEKAEKAFKKSLELNPDNWQAHYNLGELYAAAKLVQEAKKEYAAAIAHDGKSAKPHNGIGMLALFQESDCEQAKRHFRHAIQLAPNNPAPVLNMALAFSASKNYDQAEKYAAEAIVLAKPGSPIHQQAQKLADVIKREQRT